MNETDFERQCMEKSEFALSLRDDFNSWEELAAHLGEMETMYNSTPAISAGLGLITSKVYTPNKEIDPPMHAKDLRALVSKEVTFCHFWVDNRWIISSRKRGKTADAPYLSVFDTKKRMTYTTSLQATIGVRVYVRGDSLLYAHDRQLLLYSLTKRCIETHFGMMPQLIESVAFCGDNVLVALAEMGSYLIDCHAVKKANVNHRYVADRTLTVDTTNMDVETAVPHGYHLDYDLFGEDKRMITAFDFHPSGSMIATADNLGWVFIWQITRNQSDGKLVCEIMQDITYREEGEEGRTDTIYQIMFLFNAVVYHGSDFSVVCRFPMVNGEAPVYYVRRVPNIGAVALHGQYLFVLLGDFQLLMLDLYGKQGEDLKWIHKIGFDNKNFITGFTNTVRRLAVSKDRVVSAGQSGFFRVAHFTR